ncbi:hypothetical protein RA280_31375 [Cupriavidus sp. CV2]|uniref:hypothetical protein n=1 Tax=Cupriavidus ulmosensis TaxID=3065913 RepID=UPI00296B1329|nr:hypothetical protein [Cupriavidus sp. CV2]MDW3686164.1 hypothetical protein [Cupriavidus sp. CV2]
MRKILLIALAIGAGLANAAEPDAKLPVVRVVKWTLTKDGSVRTGYVPLSAAKTDAVLWHDESLYTWTDSCSVLKDGTTVTTKAATDLGVTVTLAGDPQALGEASLDVFPLEVAVSARRLVKTGAALSDYGKCEVDVPEFDGRISRQIITSRPGEEVVADATAHYRLTYSVE